MSKLFHVKHAATTGDSGPRPTDTFATVEELERVLGADEGSITTRDALASALRDWLSTTEPGTES